MTLRHDALVTNSTSYLDGPGFESRPRPNLRLFLVFPQSFKACAQL